MITSWLESKSHNLKSLIAIKLTIHDNTIIRGKLNNTTGTKLFPLLDVMRTEKQLRI